MRRRVAAAVCAAAMVAGCTPVAQPALRTLPVRRELPQATVHILALGDSITVGGKWQAELGRLLDEAGVPHVIVTSAVGGTGCDYWPPRIAGLLDQHQPTVLMLACGTNTDPTATIYGEPLVTWSWRFTVEAAHARGVAVIPALIQYSDPILAPDWLLANEPWTNDRLYGEMRRHWDWWPNAVADFQLIPATASYLVADPYGAPPYQIAIHPTDRGYRYMGRVEYDAGARAGLWPATVEPPLCDMHGHRKGYQRPAYVPCPDV